MKEFNAKYDMGQILKDRFTGFVGSVMGITFYFTGCIHYGLCAKELREGKPVEWQWFEETRLDAVNKKTIKTNERNKPTSGPEPNAPQLG